MKTKYDELTLTHNISGVILPSKRYEHIYKKGAYLIPPIIALYDETINKDAKIIEVHRAEGKHEDIETTGICTKRPTMPVEPSLWRWWTKRGTRSLRTRTPSTRISQPSSSSIT